MEGIYGVRALQRALRALNQKEERELRRQLSLLDKQRSYACRTLRRRRDSLREDARRAATAKLCEPKATVNAAMKEIREHQSAAFRRGVGARTTQRDGGSEAAEQSRSASAPPPPPGKPDASARSRRSVQSSLSLVQMKHIADIDSISERELVRRRKKARDDSERLRQLRRETLHAKVAAFVESLRDKGSGE